MTRTLKADAIVLKTNPVGENHRGLTMLVRGEGLLRPLAFGAQSRRSALRAAALPYNRGAADFHYDGSKDSWRLTAFDPEDTHEGLREDLDRFYTATSWAEILLKSHGAGDDSSELFDLAASGFSLLSRVSGTDIDKLSAAFLWFFLGVDGVQPDPDLCGRCGRRIPVSDPDSPARYLADGLLVGPECSPDSRPQLDSDVRRWLTAIGNLTLEDALNLDLTPNGPAAGKTWLLTVVQTLLERPLRSLASSGRQGS